jgi:hypothetical protein
MGSSKCMSNDQTLERGIMKQIKQQQLKAEQSAKQTKP